MFSLRLARQWLILPLHLAYNSNPRELMNEPTTLGAYLRRERERRGLALRTISETTKVSIGLLEGLEADNISRWPGGIFRRAFVRSYAECVGLDPDDVAKRFERQHAPAEPEVTAVDNPAVSASLGAAPARAATSRSPAPPQRARTLGTAADLTVAIVLAFGSAAAGSRLLWPVLLIAAYYAIGILLTGTSPMVALLSEAPATSSEPRPVSAAAASEQVPAPPAAPARVQPRRTNERPRQRRGAQARA
jgi:transcriptional regulator with XRE-family HTH domain